MDTLKPLAPERKLCAYCKNTFLSFLKLMEKNLKHVMIVGIKIKYKIGNIEIILNHLNVKFFYYICITFFYCWFIP